MSSNSALASIADGVDRHRQSSPIRRADHRPHRTGLGDKHAAILRIHQVGLEHLRGARTERTIHETLDAADMNKVVAEIRLDAEMRRRRDAARPASVDRAARSCARREPTAEGRGTSSPSVAALPSMSCTLVMPFSAQARIAACNVLGDFLQARLRDQSAHQAHGVVFAKCRSAFCRRPRRKLRRRPVPSCRRRSPPT